jgi:hypothetical protein
MTGMGEAAPTDDSRYPLTLSPKGERGQRPSLLPTRGGPGEGVRSSSSDSGDGA